MNGGRIKPGEVRNPRGLGGPKRKTREAYEHAIAILNNRPGISDSADLAVVRNYDGPVIVGKLTMPDQEREIPADIRRIADEAITDATMAEPLGWMYRPLMEAFTSALMAERERNIDAVRQALQTDYYDWGSLADSLEAAIRDRSGREK